MFRYSLVFMTGLFMAAPVLAGSWADGMFDGLSKDFGTVPRGPGLQYPFRLTNNTGSTVHIASLRVSCGCVTAVAQESTLAPGQSTTIVANMDTRKFTGPKNVTIFVQFDRPSYEEVRLWVQANGRDDLTIAPDTLVFGQIKRGSSPSISTTITLFSNGQWQIVSTQSESNYIQTNLKEVRRNGGEVVYQLTAQVRADAPVGKWFSDVWLKTDHAANPRVRVPLTVEVESSLTISPAEVVFNEVKVGSEAERKVIVRGVKPFRITALKGTDAVLTAQDNTPDSKPVHVLSVGIKPTRPGELKRTIRIVTDLEEEGEIEFQTRAQVVP